MMRRIVDAFFGIVIGLSVAGVSGEVLVRLYLLRHTVYDIEMTKYANALKIDSPNPKIGHLHRPNLYEPDQVVVFYFINDAEITPKKSTLWFLGYSRFSFFWSRFQSLRNNLSRDRSVESYYAALYHDDQPGWINAREAFVELKAACEKRGIGLQVVLLPELHGLVAYPFTKEYGLVEAFLRQNGIECIDL